MIWTLYCRSGIDPAAGSRADAPGVAVRIGGAPAAGSLKAGWFEQVRVTRPVVVVGNITVGGTGKTPFTIWLADALRRRGRRVGIVLRGYGGRIGASPTHVTGSVGWEQVGDEAVMLARATRSSWQAATALPMHAWRSISVPMWSFPMMVCSTTASRAIARLSSWTPERLLGNERLLPAGPLREPYRLEREGNCVVLMHKGASIPPTRVLEGTLHPVQVAARARLTQARAIVSGEFGSSRASRAGGCTQLQESAPQAFFAALRAAGLDVIPHAMRDHAVLTKADLTFDDDAPVLMTEKDAVRCERIAGTRHWAVAMTLDLSEADIDSVLTIVESARPTESPHDGTLELMDSKLLDILACPLCKGPLQYSKAQQVLVCRADRLAYPVRDGIPVMLEEEARQLGSDDALLKD